MIETPRNPILKTTHKFKKITLKTRNMQCEREKPVTWRVWERVDMGKTMNRHKSSREKLIYLRKTRNFRDWVKSRASHQGQSPKHLKHKFWKICLSVFRDWKFYPRGKLRKSLCTPRDWNLHRRTSRQTESWETIKTQILKNILSIFRDWDIDPLVSHEKSLCGLATRTCDWTNPRLSRQNKATLFLKILTFLQKQKTFQKQLKHLKIFLCLINKDWACENTFNQVQSHK